MIHLQKHNSINWKCIGGIILQIPISLCYKMLKKTIATELGGDAGMEYQHINREYAISSSCNVRVVSFYEDTIGVLMGLWVLSNCHQIADCLTIRNSEDVLLGDKAVSSVKTMIIFICTCHPVN